VLAVLACRAVARWLPTPFGLLALRWLRPGELRPTTVLEPRFSRADEPQAAPVALAA
jgi:hypothetical protein